MSARRRFWLFWLNVVLTGAVFASLVAFTMGWVK